MNETPDQSWVPERRVFLRRTVLVAALTLLGLVLVGLILSRAGSVSIYSIWPTAGLMTAGFLFDDLTRWRTAKLDRWMLSEGHLHHHDSNGTITIPLDQISSVRSRFGSRVIVSLTSGQKVELRYLKDARMITQQIEAILPQPIKALALQT